MDQEKKSILSIALMAAFSDSHKADSEREAIKRVAESFSSEAALHVPGLYQDVLLKRVRLDDLTESLKTPETRNLAYEMAVCVCDADGIQTEEEKIFLETLRTKLGLQASAAREVNEKAEALALSPVSEPALPDAVPPAVTAAAAAAGAAAAGAAEASVPAETPQQQQKSAENLDPMILNYSILNGALELLPDSLSSLAIIPLQMKMVYRIGKSHGYELDRGHIKDFLATAGVGLTSQYLEKAGAKIIGKILGKAGGKILGGLGRQAVSSAFSFASTYALGQVAKTYYAGGRKLSAVDLKASFNGLLGQAKTLEQRYQGEIAEKARTLDLQQILASVRA